MRPALARFSLAGSFLLLAACQTTPAPVANPTSLPSVAPSVLHTPSPGGPVSSATPAPTALPEWTHGLIQPGPTPTPLPERSVLPTTGSYRLHHFETPFWSADGKVVASIQRTETHTLPAGLPLNDVSTQFARYDLAQSEWTYPESGRSAVRVMAAHPQQPSWAFLNEEGELLRFDLASEQATRLAPEQGMSAPRSVQWSPDGKQLLYLTQRLGTTQLSRLDGGAQKFLQGTPWNQFMTQMGWLPDGSGIVWCTRLSHPSFDPEIPRWEDTLRSARWDQNEVQTLLKLPPSPAGPQTIVAFAFSPDRQRLALVVEREELNSSHTGIFLARRLFLANADGSGLREVPGLQRVGTTLSWAPDSSALVVSAGQGEAAEAFGARIWRIDAKGLSTTALTRSNNLYREDHGPQWSPDGRQILFLSNQGADFARWPVLPNSLWLMNADGQQARILIPETRN
ncbi:MAG: hypothetical protein ACO1RX_22075 [Candidatus Sericytochromatia bacterium]